MKDNSVHYGINKVVSINNMEQAYEQQNFIEAQMRQHFMKQEQENSQRDIFAKLEDALKINNQMVSQNNDVMVAHDDSQDPVDYSGQSFSQNELEILVPPSTAENKRQNIKVIEINTVSEQDENDDFERHEPFNGQNQQLSELGQTGTFNNP